MVINAPRLDRRSNGVPEGRVTARVKSTARSAHRGESWRDWAVIALLNHGQLLVVALLRPAWPWLLLAALPLGLTFAIGTLTILHDAGHRRFARKEWPNVFAVQTSVPLGLWVGHWTLKHRVHHRASQVFPVDEATRSNLVRMHPAVPLRPFHRYQHIYAWFLYGLAWIGELKSQLTYLGNGYIAGTETPSRAERARSFLVEKVFWALMLLPYALLMGIGSLAVYLVTAMSFGSVLAAVVLVVGHINEGLEPPTEVPSQREWSRHLVRTTASFNTGSLPVRWLTGGMTHHLAHHLRPVAPRYELPVLHDTVVQNVVVSSGLPLVEYPTLTSATISHGRRLRELGRPDPASTGGR
jgi:linoleoyl-CoA desaturase